MRPARETTSGAISPVEVVTKSHEPLNRVPCQDGLVGLNRSLTYLWLDAFSLFLLNDFCLNGLGCRV